MSKCGRNVLKTRRYDSALSTHFFFSLLIKTAAKFMLTESVKCPARAVFAKSRARHVHIMSLNLLISHKSPLINRVSYVHSRRTTDESLHYFVLPFQLILYSRIETARHLVRSDFLQRSICRRVPRVKKSGKIQKEHMHLSLSLSLLVDPPMECLLWCLQTRFRSRSDPNHRYSE